MEDQGVSGICGLVVGVPGVDKAVAVANVSRPAETPRLRRAEACIAEVAAQVRLPGAIATRLEPLLEGTPHG